MRHFIQFWVLIAFHKVSATASAADYACIDNSRGPTHFLAAVDLCSSDDPLQYKSPWCAGIAPPMDITLCQLIQAHTPSRQVQWLILSSKESMQHAF